MNDPILLGSPLQGFTDFHFRNAISNQFGGIDRFFAPYIRLNGKLDIKKVYQRDLAPDNNQNQKWLTPQVMCNQVDEFMFVLEYISALGYKELNWNLGCPYPMVAKKAMGSGLICHPDKIGEILEKACSQNEVKISLKMRLGYLEKTEILDTFSTLDAFDLEFVAIHARLGVDLYKKQADLEAFSTCIGKTKHPLYYNGDITSVEKFREIKKAIPEIQHFLIGRGLLQDPFLAKMIHEDTLEYPVDRYRKLEEYHNDLYTHYLSTSSGPTPIKMKMLGFWEYFSYSFPESAKVYKKIKKASNTKNYQWAVEEIFQNAKKQNY
ncbi:MAG: dihydrouridine synthase [Flavobacteriaceae bacterium]|nr:MAG: dihydrouridine synthase [Flavobacteriaceae bacterium]